VRAAVAAWGDGRQQGGHVPSRVPPLAPFPNGGNRVQVPHRVAELGTYKYNLALTALPPTSEASLRFDAPLGGNQTGPFEVPVNGSKDVQIRKVFAQDREYVFTVDHPAFSIASSSATTKAKDAANCSVNYAPQANSGGGGDTTKLFVSCPAAPDMPPWVFYLTGGPGK
jgi:hypothetical protein